MTELDNFLCGFISRIKLNLDIFQSLIVVEFLGISAFRSYLVLNHVSFH